MMLSLPGIKKTYKEIVHQSGAVFRDWLFFSSAPQECKEGGDDPQWALTGAKSMELGQFTSSDNLHPPPQIPPSLG